MMASTRCVLTELRLTGSLCSLIVTVQPFRFCVLHAYAKCCTTLMPDLQLCLHVEYSCVGRYYLMDLLVSLVFLAERGTFYKCLQINSYLIILFE